MRFVMALAMLLMTSPSFAGETPPPLTSGPPTSGPLAPGKPAGVAQASNHELFVYISLSLIAVTVGGVALTYIHTSPSTPATTTP
jgi:hypothetical protein